MLRAIFASLRVQQWVKNFFLFAPLIFAKHLAFQNESINVAIGFILFSLVASGVYILNDVADSEQDKLHPEKQNRPIPSGKISKHSAILISASLIFVSILLSFAFHDDFAILVILYTAINILYSLKLKHVVILDVMIIATGFVLRVFAGAVIIKVPVSEWLLICTFLLSLFLGFIKRRNEILVLETKAEYHRKVLEQYSVTFLDQMVNIVTACTVISYALYTISEETIQKFHTRTLIFTVPFVLFGIFRYLYLIHNKNIGGNPTKIVLTDIPLIINIALWMSSVLYIIYA